MAHMRVRVCLKPARKTRGGTMLRIAVRVCERACACVWASCACWQWQCGTTPPPPPPASVRVRGGTHIYTPPHRPPYISLLNTCSSHVRFCSIALGPIPLPLRYLCEWLGYTSPFRSSYTESEAPPKPTSEFSLRPGGGCGTKSLDSLHFSA